MYLTADEIEKLLASAGMLVLLPHRYWLGTILDRAYAAGRAEGIEIGRNQVLAERATGQQQGIKEHPVESHKPMNAGSLLLREDLHATDRSAYESGRRARRDGCHRVLANPDSPDQLAEWQSGWDDEDLLIRVRKRNL